VSVIIPGSQNYINNPSGTPASLNTFHNDCAENIWLSLGFQTTTLPSQHLREVKDYGT
jgi:hypothetical protein